MAFKVGDIVRRQATKSEYWLGEPCAITAVDFVLEYCSGMVREIVKINNVATSRDWWYPAEYFVIDTGKRPPVTLVPCCQCVFLGIKDYVTGYCKNPNGIIGVIKISDGCSRGKLNKAAEESILQKVLHDRAESAKGE